MDITLESEFMGLTHQVELSIAGNSVIIITLRQRLVNPFRPGVR